MIGLIFGETDFPKYIHKKIKELEAKLQEKANEYISNRRLG